MDQISLTADFRDPNSGARATTVGARKTKAMAQGENEGPRTFEHSAAIKVKNALSFFDVSSKRQNDLQDEAEEIDDILNLNPGMLAGAFVFFERTGNQFNEHLFKKHSNDIIEVLLDSRVLIPSTRVSTGNTDPAEYASDLLRYIFRVGIERGLSMPEF